MRRIARGLIARRELGFEVAGYLDEALASGSAADGVPVLGSLEDFPEISRSLAPDRVVADLPSGGHALPPSSFRKLAAAEIPIETPDALYELLFGRVSLDSLGDSALIFSSFAAPRNAMAIQSVYNNVVALLSIVALGPFMILTALVVKISSGGPVLE